ncbi:MAG TPA: hypothetical protein VGL28_02665 [Steroidobacteraceae bacterium]|jgi:hypothetical protein
MIKTYSLYEAASGLFTGKRLHCDDEGLLAVRLPAGTLALEGSYDHRTQRMDLTTGAVIAYRPPAPSPEHEWDPAGKRWQVRAAPGTDGRTGVIYARIQALEASQGRAVREATLGDEQAMKRLKEIDAEIHKLREELARA